MLGGRCARDRKRRPGRWERFAIPTLLGCLSTSCVFWDSQDWSSHFIASNAGLDAAAEASAGAPQVLATASIPWGIAVDAQYVYFASSMPGGSVSRCPLSGCTTPTVLASNLATPSRLVIDAQRVYWANYGDGSIDSCDKLNGCSSGPTIIATQQGSPVGIAVDGTSVYWANAVSVANGGSVSSCPLSGCPSSGPNVIAPSEDYPFAVAVDTTGVYWVTTDGDVRFCSQGGCAQPKTLASNQGNLENLALWAGNVYWTNRSDQVNGGNVGRCSESQCSSTVETISNAEQPLGIAVDATGVYWADFIASGTVQMCPLTGCSASGPVLLASGQASPFGIALDTNYVYFTDSNESSSQAMPMGQVLRVAKPAP
jgi:hypothetical protein